MTSWEATNIPTTSLQFRRSEEAVGVCVWIWVSGWRISPTYLQGETEVSVGVGGQLSSNSKGRVGTWIVCPETLIVLREEAVVVVAVCFIESEICLPGTNIANIFGITIY